MAIDYKLISQLEGGQQKKFYTVEGQPNSGVTIATGFDLGSRSPEQLLKAGIAPSLVDKMMPYFGKKGKEADKALADNPVILSEEEEKELDKLDVLAKKQQTDIVIEQLTDRGVDFNSLPSAVQTVIASVGYQYGQIKHLQPDGKGGRTKKVSSFFNKIIESSKTGNFEPIIQELNNFGDSFSPRRKQEASYLENVLKLPQGAQRFISENGVKAFQQVLIDNGAEIKADGVIGNNTMNAYESSGIDFVKDEEQEVPQVEEQGFLDRIGDFFSDTFGMSAEASDVPPIETLQEPQEEVPMSPTDAMRAQSQGRVILDSAQSVPTNPEAGPSDTVPAMLTPGEAVIPAAAAQDPDNIPVIEKMIDEGRAKNRMAEANGVPVNGKEAIMYDDAELDAYHKRNKTGKYGGGEQSLQGFAGGTMNIPKGMHMMPDGSLMKDEDHKGYGHGTMDVPAMLMMAPPKDPAMDEMEKLALKQMGYEMKSKNRTRDTIEKIGLKHLEDTADANMKQAALDETMKNYGMEVPMPMQPVPQGFQDGSSYATEGSLDQTDLRGMQNLLVNSGVATPEEAFVDPIYAARERKLAELEAEAQAQKEQEALYAQESAREANLALAAEQEAIANDPTLNPADRQRAQARVGQLEQAVPPVQAPQVAQVAVEEDKTPAPRPDPKDPGDDDEEGGFLATLGKGFKAAFKSVFDPESIATAGIYYGVNRLLGYDNETAAQQAAAGYNVGQKNRLAKLEYARKMGLESVEDARQRDEQANENIGKLSTFISSQLDDEISDEVLKEAGLSRADVANRINMMVQGRGLDLSTTKGLNAARTLATRVTANYSKRVNAGLEASPEEEFDRVLLSQYELTQALTDDDGKPLSEAATRGSFDKIRRNVAADRGIKEDEAQFVFEDRVNQAYQIFTNPANADKIQALRDQGLLTPGPGENEFSLFLAYVLKDKDSRVRNF